MFNNIKARNSLRFAPFSHGMSNTRHDGGGDFAALFLYWTVWINDRHAYHPMTAQLEFSLIVIGRVRIFFNYLNRFERVAGKQETASEVS